MKQTAVCEPRLRELIDTDLPADELERLAHVDALLRTAAGDESPCERTRASISAALDRELSELESIRRREHVERCASCRAFQADAEAFATALRTAPLEPLSRPLAVPSRGRGAIPSHERRAGGNEIRPRLRLVTAPRATAGATRQRTEQETYELKLSFGELSLIYKSLQAAKTLGALPPQDELLDDTIQVVDQALREAI